MSCAIEVWQTAVTATPNGSPFQRKDIITESLLCYGFTYKNVYRTKNNWVCCYVSLLDVRVHGVCLATPAQNLFVVCTFGENITNYSPIILWRLLVYFMLFVVCTFGENITNYSPIMTTFGVLSERISLITVLLWWLLVYFRREYH